MITEIQKLGTTLTCRIANTGENGYAEFPLMLYKGYVAEHMETGEMFDITAGYNNAVRVEIPSGFTGTLQVSFKEPVYWRIAEIVSTLSIIGLLIFGIINYKCNRPKKS